MAIHHPLTLPRHSGKLLILFLHVKVVHSGATFHSVETAGMSRYTTIPAVTETTRTVRQVWIDARKSEVIDAPYFHVVFTVPSELNSLIYANQKLLYALLHRCSSETLLELSSDRKYFGATPSIIQVLHTWGQTLNYHPHIHCIVTGDGLTKDYRFKTSSGKFFIPVNVLGSKFRGKFLACLNSYQRQGRLVLHSSCEGLHNPYA